LLKPLIKYNFSSLEYTTGSCTISQLYSSSTDDSDIEQHQSIYKGLFYLIPFKLKMNFRQLQFQNQCPCASTEHHTMKMHWGNGDTAPCTPDLSSRWRWVS